MSYRQWKRVVRLTITGKAGELVIENLKIEFEATKHIGSKQNEATISVWNLSRATRQKLGEEYDQVKLEAGYREGPVAVIFSGSIRDVTNTIDGEADIKSELDCGDGDEAFDKGAVSKTFPSGTKPKAMVEALVKTLPGVTAGPIKGLDDLPATKRPVSFFGRSWRELDELGRAYGFYWSIQNGAFQAVKADQHLGGAVVLSKDTGLIGIPEETDKGIKFKALLNPLVKPGALVDIRSQFLDEESGRDKTASDGGGGLHRVAECTFSGGNRGNDFYVSGEGNRVQGDKVTK